MALYGFVITDELQCMTSTPNLKGKICLPEGKTS